ncbi:MAG: phosphoribosylformylglycinamidine synthase I [Candidatus Micrarchaeota archaeon]
MDAKAAVFYGYGINCDYETEYALRIAGAQANRVHIYDVIANPKMLEEFNLLAFPGGFSYGDDIGSGKVLANKMKFKLKEQIEQFVNEGKLVIGICNGFQIVVKMGLLPYNDFVQKATLTFNHSGKFEDRWVYLKINQKSPCVFTRDMDELMLPVRHGEGKFITDDDTLNDLILKNLLVMQYVNTHNELGAYPYNPNGSMLNIAGICNEKGNVFGLMPHPEAYNTVLNNPFWPNIKNSENYKNYINNTDNLKGPGIRIFENAVSYLNERF